MPVNNPYQNDQKPKNSESYPRGRFVWMKVEFRQSANGPLIAPAADFASHPTLITITDTNGADVTGAWLTNDIDPQDPSDVFGAGHADYTGTVGIFHDGGGNIAAKVFIPAGAAIAAPSAPVPYRVSWEVKHPNGSFIVDSEVFGVDISALLIFGTSVSAEDVTSGIQTSLTTDDIEFLLGRAERWARSRLESCEIDPDSFDTLPYAVLEAIILKTQGYIIRDDASAGGLVTMRKEGSKQIRYSASSDKLMANFFEDADNELMLYCKKFGPTHRVRFHTYRQGPNQGNFTHPQNRGKLFRT